jgi:preprotein translocase subunit SecB
MSEVKPSNFIFQNFRVLKSALNFSEIQQADYSININPKGEFNRRSKVYKLILDVKINSKLGVDIINIISESVFSFDDQVQDEIPPYFTLNAPAITFPYIRAYIAALTSLSGTGTMNLPTLNLVDLIEKLKENYKVIEE